MKLTHAISSTTGETRSPSDWMTGTHVEYCVVLICDTATVCPDSWLDTICLNCTVVLNTEWADVEARFCDIALVITAFVFISWLAAEITVCGRFNGDAPLSSEREFWTLSFPLASSRTVWKQKTIIFRDFKIRPRQHQRERQKSNRFNEQNNFARAARIFVHFFVVTARLRHANA